MTKKIEDVRATLSEAADKAFIRALNRAWELDSMGVDRMSDAGYRLFKYANEQATEALEAFDYDIEAVEEMWASGEYPADTAVFERICKRMKGQAPKMFGDYLVAYEPNANGASTFDLVINYDEESVRIQIGGQKKAAA